MFNLEYFANDNYKVLKFLYDNQIQVKDEYYIVLFLIPTFLIVSSSL